jgi:hypothetical protein
VSIAGNVVVTIIAATAIAPYALRRPVVSECRPMRVVGAALSYISNTLVRRCFLARATRTLVAGVPSDHALLAMLFERRRSF